MIFKKELLTTAVLLALGSAASALPSLQLGMPAADGTYDGSAGVETTIANGPVFDLDAYLFDSDPGNPQANAGQFYLSMALIGATGPGSFGSFTYDGNPVNVTADMISGTPSALGAHGIFPTYYFELLFDFTADTTVPAFNTADGSSAGGNMFKHTFSFDVSGLTGGAGVHFDLYGDVWTPGRGPNPGSYKQEFAPFSHDAETGASSSSGGGPSSGEVPEPGTMSLIGAAVMLGSLTMSRRRRVARG